MCLLFWAYFIRIAKRNNFIDEFFSIRALFRREKLILKFKLRQVGHFAKNPEKFKKHGQILPM
jgi:hypothetical protein